MKMGFKLDVYMYYLCILCIICVLFMHYLLYMFKCFIIFGIIVFSNSYYKSSSFLSVNKNACTFKF